MTTAKQRPDRWITGPDPLTHAQYRAFIQQRNQARWRDELWTLTFEEFQQVWGALWHQRGRGPDQYMLSRQDWSRPWMMKNVQVLTRQQHGQRQADLRQQGYRSLARRRVLSAENNLTKR